MIFSSGLSAAHVHGNRPSTVETRLVCELEELGPQTTIMG